MCDLALALQPHQLLRCAHMLTPRPVHCEGPPAANICPLHRASSPWCLSQVVALQFASLGGVANDGMREQCAPVELHQVEPLHSECRAACTVDSVGLVRCTDGTWRSPAHDTPSRLHVGAEWAGREGSPELLSVTYLVKKRTGTALSCSHMRLRAATLRSKSHLKWRACQAHLKWPRICSDGP